ncbi:helix-turn-helix transcriptional regulator [Corynebacterium liangguodongii]|uniref:WYL domain-containing protein n=1 Tax=Corynebacterium liangguodongii TaxID=2079535 RepID=A0A2S0WE06_9CORY|nr:WYL domain-containing protein [Corynebacterium liangguodongii]AWB84001.1 WYL domain-containing protein [Corynebacterium liangguodongii]PWC00013.1 WYL domain-containing protein [Corynebacterium liangguodongii]
MAEDSAVNQRLTNLTFALLGSPRPRDYDWVGSHVEGYEGRTGPTLARQLSRDILTVRRAGVPARMENGLVWVDKDAYELPAIELTDAEATVLGLAGDLGSQGSLGAFARSGWTKLAASGATRTFDSPSLDALDNDVVRLDAQTVKNVTACVRGNRRMVFDYLPAPLAEPQRRVMDPWGIVAVRGRAYVVGWDVERGAERAFRATRISNVRASREPDFTPPTRPLRQVVDDVVRGPVVDAVVSIPPGRGAELEARGTRDGASITFEGVERDWLVRTCVGLAPDVEGIEPADVRADVIALLEKGAEDDR